MEKEKETFLFKSNKVDKYKQCYHEKKEIQTNI